MAPLGHSGGLRHEHICLSLALFFGDVPGMSARYRLMRAMADAIP